MLREFITVNREEIISRCRAKAVKRVAVPPSPKPAIDHGVPIFLDELVDELRLKPLPNPAIRKTATKHGRDLMRQGFNVSQVVHGYGDVCQSITELAVEQKAPISADDFRLLNRALDDAIAAAVTQYAEDRDESAQGQAADETGRLGALAHKLRSSIRSARVALGAIQSGRVGIAGSTGTVLDQHLSEANDLIERLLAAEVFGARRSTLIKSDRKQLARLAAAPQESSARQNLTGPAKKGID